MATNQTTLTSTIDQVVYLAALASNPHEIDPQLDKLRAITAQLALKAMRWLYRALAVSTVASLSVLVYELLASGHTAFLPLAFIPFIIGGFLFLKSGYEFNKIVHYQ
jgi:hypothetical protein